MTTTPPTPTVTRRPYILTFKASQKAYPVSSYYAQQVIRDYEVVSATRERVVLKTLDGLLVSITPATVGGGPAFTLSRP